MKKTSNKKTDKNVTTEFARLKDAFDYAKQNNVELTYFGLQHNTYKDCKQPCFFSYLGVVENDVDRLINKLPITIKTIAKNRIKNREIDKSVYYVNSESFITNNLFEILTNDTRKVCFDIDKLEMTEVDFTKFVNDFNDAFNKCISEFRTDTGAKQLPFYQPLIFVRQEIDHENNILDLVKSAHIIYKDLRINREQNQTLAIVLNHILFRGSQDHKIDKSIYYKNKNFCMLGMCKVKDYDKRFFIPFGDYTKENSVIHTDHSVNVTEIKNFRNGVLTEKLQLIKYEPIGKAIEHEEQPSMCIEVSVEDEKLVTKMCEHLPERLFKYDRNTWKDLTIFIHQRANNDIMEWLKYSYRIFKNETATDEMCEEYLKSIDHWYVHKERLFRILKKCYNINFQIIDTYRSQFLLWASKECNINHDRLLDDVKAYDFEMNEFHAGNAPKPEPRIEINNNKGEFLTILLNQHVITNETSGGYKYYAEAMERKLAKNQLKNRKKLTIKQIQQNILAGKYGSHEIYDAYYGSGKTLLIVNERITKVIEEHGTDTRILLLSCNNNLNTETTASFTEKFKNTDITVGGHLDVIKSAGHMRPRALKDLRSKNIIICSLESLRTFLYNMNFHLIVLDESESILGHYTAKTMNKKNNNDEFDEEHGGDCKTWDYFAELIKSAREVIALDANITERRVKLLNNIIKDTDKNRKFNVVYCSTNIFSDVKRRLWLVPSQMDNDLYKSLKSNQRVVIASSLKNVANTYYELFKTNKNNFIGDARNIMLINGDAIVKIYDHRSDTERSICRVIVFGAFKKHIMDHDIDLIIYSPSVTVGISVYFEACLFLHTFDKLYAIACNKNCPVLAVFEQMSKRFRQLKMNEINIMPFSNLHFNAYTCVDYRNVSKYQIFSDLRMKYGDTLDANNLNETYIENTIINKTESFESSCRFMQELCKLLIKDNCIIELVYEPSIKLTNKKVFREISDEQKQAIITLWIKTPPATHDELEQYDKLKDTNELIPEELGNKIEKYYDCKKYTGYFIYGNKNVGEWCYFTDYLFLDRNFVKNLLSERYELDDLYKFEYTHQEYNPHEGVSNSQSIDNLQKYRNVNTAVKTIREMFGCVNGCAVLPTSEFNKILFSNIKTIKELDLVHRIISDKPINKNLNFTEEDYKNPENFAKAFLKIIRCYDKMGILIGYYGDVLKRVELTNDGILAFTYPTLENSRTKKDILICVINSFNDRYTRHNVNWRYKLKEPLILIKQKYIETHRRVSYYSYTIKKWDNTLCETEYIECSKSCLTKTDKTINRKRLANFAHGDLTFSGLQIVGNVGKVETYSNRQLYNKFTIPEDASEIPETKTKLLCELIKMHKTLIANIKHKVHIRLVPINNLLDLYVDKKQIDFRKKASDYEILTFDVIKDLNFAYEKFVQENVQETPLDTTYAPKYGTIENISGVDTIDNMFQPLFKCWYTVNEYIMEYKLHNKEIKKRVIADYNVNLDSRNFITVYKKIN